VTRSASADDSASLASDETAYQRIQEHLTRRELAATRHRFAVRRSVALDEAEMLALPTAVRGQLTPTHLRHALGYTPAESMRSSGGSSATGTPRDSGTRPTAGAASLCRRLSSSRRRRLPLAAGRSGSTSSGQAPAPASDASSR